MALDVLGDMSQQACNGGGQMPAADRSRLGKRGKVQRANHSLRLAEDLADRRQKLLTRERRWFRFRRQRGQLLRGKYPSLQIGDQAIRASGDMAQVEGDGSESVRSRPKLGRVECLCMMIQVFASLLEGEKDWGDQRMDAGNRAAEPGFGRMFRRRWGRSLLHELSVHPRYGELLVHLRGVVRGHHYRFQHIVLFRLESRLVQNLIGDLDALVHA